MVKLYIRHTFVVFIVLWASKIHAVPITVGGTDYDVTHIYTSFIDSAALLESQAWWDQPILADEFAVALNEQVSWFGPAQFAYQLISERLEVFTKVLGPGDVVSDNTLNIFELERYAIATVIDATVPEPPIALLLASGLMVFGIVRRKPSS